MTDARWQALMGEKDLKLTEKEIAEGWHFCADWDGLLIAPERDDAWGTDPAECRCGYINPRPNKDFMP